MDTDEAAELSRLSAVCRKKKMTLTALTVVVMVVKIRKVRIILDQI